MPRSPLAAVSDNDSLYALADSPGHGWDETWVGNRYVPLVYAETLLVALPNVPFAAVNYIE